MEILILILIIAFLWEDIAELLLVVCKFIFGIFKFTVLCIALVGAAIGGFWAIKVLKKAIVTVFSERKSFDGRFISPKEKVLYDEAQSKSSIKVYFEDYARNFYFLGPCFADIVSIVQYSFKELYALDIKKADDLAVIGFSKKMSVYVFGTIFTIAFATLFLLISLPIGIIAAFGFSIPLLKEKLQAKIKGVLYRCPECKKEYKIPIVLCPNCGIRHKNLKPGKFGAHKRKCLCGAVLPTRMGSHVTCKTYDSSNTYNKKRIEYNKLSQLCPYCEKSHNAGISHPINIALIGGSSAGKTTFKVAFVHDFLDEEVPLKMKGVDVGFPTAKIEAEYEECCKQYIGRPILSTERGKAYDIYTFAFRLSCKEFKADRMIQIYDMPGEAFQRGDVKEGWGMYTFSEGAVILLDPYILPNVRRQNADEIEGASMGNATMDMEELMTSLIETLRTVRTPKSKKGKYTIPIALAINKADSRLLKQQVGDEAVKKLMTAQPNIFKDYYTTMDYVCRCFLVDNGGENFIANLDMNFETVHFFSCSPMGAVPRGAAARFTPFNVIGIMQWMMLRADKELGVVWKPDKIVSDVSDEMKEFTRSNKAYYDDVITANLEY